MRLKSRVEPKASPTNLLQSFGSLTRLVGRTRSTTADELKDSFKMLSEYRDGGVFVSTFAGDSQWEKHSNGDELVYAVEGETDLMLFIEGKEVRHTLHEGYLIVVPQNIWHRFETRGVKILTVTPQPTDHYSGDFPDG